MATVDFNVTGDDLNRVQREWSRADVLLLARINRALRRIGGIVVPALKANTPVGKGPKRAAGQRLAASTRGLIEGAGLDQRYVVRQGARTHDGTFYGRFVREGTRAHVIRPIPPRKALRFSMGGRMRFFSKVNHPGNRPNAYHERTMREQAGNIQTVVNEEAVALTAQLAGRT